MGELLAENELSFDKSATLLWKDVKIKSSYWRFHVKKPKSKNPKGEFIYLFPFPIEEWCPLKSLTDLLEFQRDNNLFNPELPVFRFPSGRNVTKLKLNKLLKTIFPRKSHTISCRSFRSGIPSSVGKFPELINDRHTKGWGRWLSKAFLRYEHFGKHQKRYVFAKISRALLA